MQVSCIWVLMVCFLILSKQAKPKGLILNITSKESLHFCPFWFVHILFSPFLPEAVTLSSVILKGLMLNITSMEGLHSHLLPGSYFALSLSPRGFNSQFCYFLAYNKWAVMHRLLSLTSKRNCWSLALPSELFWRRIYFMLFLYFWFL